MASAPGFWRVTTRSGEVWVPGTDATLAQMAGMRAVLDAVWVLEPALTPDDTICRLAGDSLVACTDSSTRAMALAADRTPR